MSEGIQRLALGRLLYQAYYRPRAAVARVRRRGFMQSAGDAFHHRAMVRAAAKLRSPGPAAGATTVRVHFLTGLRFWHQTAFCAWSLARFGRVDVVPVLHDDGSLDAAVTARLRHIFPTAEVVARESTEERLDAFLPRSKFPYLRSRRDAYPNLMKLTDVHVGTTGWKLVLDSDMLFFQRPDALLAWLASPARPCHMVDCETSYGYPREYLSQQCEANVGERVNVGITGLRSEAIDWERVERWAREQIETFGPHYFQEQALIAQLVAGRDCFILDGRDYLVGPSEAEVLRPVAVMHHYVADSKAFYFRHGWRQVLADDGARPR